MHKCRQRNKFKFENRLKRSTQKSHIYKQLPQLVQMVGSCWHACRSIHQHVLVQKPIKTQVSCQSSFVIVSGSYIELKSLNKCPTFLCTATGFHVWCLCWFFFTTMDQHCWNDPWCLLITQWSVPWIHSFQQNFCMFCLSYYTSLPIDKLNGLRQIP